MSDDVKTRFIDVKRLIEALQNGKEYAQEVLDNIHDVEDMPRYKRRAEAYRADIKEFDELIKELQCPITK